MSAVLLPGSVQELAEAVRSAPLVLARGGGTKWNLSRGEDPAALVVSTARLTGIIEYAPDEFTFTARAGTTLREINSTLAEHGQYLPFDPPLAEAGATLGGTVAAGANGPGRLRFGGVRDFILGIKFVDGAGQVLRLGGKVVKNAAGFDLPKFFVGSEGRFGILGEITFKVFPAPECSLTIVCQRSSPDEIVALMSEAARGRWEIDALEAPVGEGRLYIRLRGPESALELQGNELRDRWSASVMPADVAAEFWREAHHFSWAHAAGLLAKIPLTLPRVKPFFEMVRELPDARGWVGIAGNVGYLSLPPGAAPESLDARLRERGLGAAVWRGECPSRLGVYSDYPIYNSVKVALDPVGRFPSRR